ncbi:glycosyl transferase group 1 [Desulfonatronospira thiodismutans ASO3-1]|uniref:Glycosyl transferase group 1 n=1 Tax=Desulfonatronospira thiodismutans ASO3-1 TaxID=555779 RepID=D6SNA4_9BACT|nr:glycosyltransferase family 4 protein [Desulfonatronospira thiodismutans]EFI34230.1 glycosyl transferase group 1 [Desulfonatronospira thiodismutans ASO3-1]
MKWLQSNLIVISANTSWYIFNFRLRMIRELINQGFEVAVVAPEDEYLSRLVQEGCRILPINLLSKSINPLVEIKAIYQYVRIYSLLRPAAVLHFTPKPNIYGSLVAKMLGIPYINNIGGLGTAFAGNGWLCSMARVMYRFSQRSAVKIFFQNKDDLDMFIRCGMARPEQAELLPGSGVDLEKFNPELGDSGVHGKLTCRQSNDNSNQPLHEGQEYLFQAPEDNVVFLLIARLIWDKGIGEYAEAARAIKAKYPDVEFMLLGFVDDNNPGAVPEKRIREWEAEGILKWVGRQEDVRLFIARTDCVVLPSYYREGTPRSLLEAASMGKPLIAADSVGTREPVENGINGFLCRPMDAMDLAAKMQLIIDMGPEKRLAMGIRGRKKMEKEYDENIVIKKYIEDIKAVLVNHR